MEHPASERDSYFDEAADVARQNGLRYMSDDMPGISRRRHGKGFAYHDAKGRLIDDKEEIARLHALAIPPAWEEVWISPSANGHILATGRDARGRKQYRYHPHWRLVRDDAKYERIISFAQALPAIRRAVHEDLHRPGLHRQKVVASIVHLLQATLMRVGNDEYARENKSFGLTTLRNRHVRIDGSDVMFRFRGKSGVQHEIKLHDPYVVRLIRKMRDLPGQELFQYVDDDGQAHSIDSGDVNAYLREVSGEDFSAKDFRTWAGTVLATLALQAFESVDSQAQAKKNVVRAIENVAKKLGNTPSICRKCYVHPAIVESYLEGSFAELLEERVQTELVEELHALTPEEAAVLALLQQRLREADEDAGRAGQRKPAARKNSTTGERKHHAPARPAVHRTHA
ncbi:DNA topoisomerase IB [Herbaspirillum robiniae]|uniref:DNA topoisomerase n=1 Tax=Herbaspirillum robiniae TaxID=2014887 RepID=A0A246WT94_9BURK|nr:DNA topoisomerase IB [Herbaspirillum robiniae]NUU02503.1 DNA topoisomerase IB [Herbaspirillum robiniae]OWY30242.1 DNA topoisomerase I [Herbaspirillum robiniae]